MSTERSLFDNEFYYNLYPDVLDAVRRGKFRDGEHHYNKRGRKEGREKATTTIETKIDEVSDGWSKHMTLKGYKEPKPRPINMNEESVPEQFMVKMNIEYPQNNTLPYEKYFHKYFNENKPNTLRTYLPIQWTAYYVNNKYGSDADAMKALQHYLDSLDRSKKYFTVCQYDDGILNNVEGLDLLVYASGCGKAGYYPIPLLSQPYNAIPYQLHKKDIKYSFVGSDTHPIRKQLVKELKSEYVRIGMTDYDKYIDELKRSTFALCPRGYGLTSFRMYEAMAFGCIPVYISDKFWEAFNLPFTEYGIKIKESQIKDIDKILDKVDVAKMQKKVEEYYKKYFVYSSCAETIIKTLL